MKRHTSQLIFWLLLPAFYLSSLGLPSSLWAMAGRPPKEMMKEVTADTIKSEPKNYTLQDCYDLALRRSETVAISKESIAQAEADFLKASGQIIGSADFIMTRVKQPNPGDNAAPSGSSNNLGGYYYDSLKRQRQFTFHQPLFQGFRTIAAFGAAGSYTKQKKQEWIRAKQLLFQDVVDAFYNVLMAEREIKVDEKTLTALENRIKELEERENVGRSRLSEVVNTQTKYKMLKATLARVQGELLVACHVLEYLTGLEMTPAQLDDRIAIQKDTATLDEYLTFAVKRPDVIAAWNAAGLAKNGIIDAQSALWPQVSLDANHYEKREGPQGNIDWDATLTFDVPLSRGGATAGNIKESVSIWKKAKLSYQQILREAHLEIKRNFDVYHASTLQHQASADALDSAFKNYDLQKKDYSRSLVSNLEVLDALESLYSTAREENISYHQMKKQYWQLQVAAGLAP